MSSFEHPILDNVQGLRSATERHRLVCLDTVWTGTTTSYRFVCSKGHVFLRTPRRVINNLECCDECVVDGHTQRIKRLAQSAGVTWLDDKWTGSRTHYNFRCPEGHTWNRRGGKLASRMGCAFCKRSGLPVLERGLRRLQEAAARHNGECLTNTYTGVSGRYTFRCALGHCWETKGGGILQGGWCAICSHQRRGVNRTLKDGLVRLQTMAKRNNGICLSNEYKGVNARYRFRCEANHEWDIRGQDVLGGSWCRRCADQKRRKLTLANAHEAAAAQGGRCLSTEYENCIRHLSWVCKKGHPWLASLSNVRAGRWCNKCRHGVRTLEEAIQTAIERGGKCLSTEYINGSTKLHWLCGKGHSWHARYSNVRQRTWCPVCAIIRRTSSSKSNALKRYLPIR